MPDRDRNDQGQYADRVDPETVLKVFHDRDDTARPVTAGDVVEELGIARRTAHNKLNALVERGVLETRKVGARGRVWWTPQHDTAGATASDDATVDDSPTTGETTSTGHAAAENDARTRTAATVVEDVAKATWEDTDDRLEARKAAARAVLEYAREHGGVSKQEAKEHVYPEYPVAGQDARTWYRKNIRPVLNEVAEYDQSTRAYELTDDLKP